MWRGLGRKLIFLDEVVFSKLSMQKLEWSGKNKNITVDEAKVRAGYIAVCATISEGVGIESLAFQGKAFNQFAYIQFLYWIRYMHNNEPLAIFADNLSVHLCANTMKACRYLNIKMIFNLPYSPDYNPIEMVFSQVKKIFKSERLQKLANQQPFDSTAAADDAFYAIPVANIDSCIRHSDELLRNLNN